jgi:hypothetical protein
VHDVKISGVTIADGAATSTTPHGALGGGIYDDSGGLTLDQVVATPRAAAGRGAGRVRSLVGRVETRPFPEAGSRPSLLRLPIVHDVVESQHHQQPDLLFGRFSPASRLIPDQAPAQRRRPTPTDSTPRRSGPGPPPRVSVVHRLPAASRPTDSGRRAVGCPRTATPSPGVPPCSAASNPRAGDAPAPRP